MSGAKTIGATEYGPITQNGAWRFFDGMSWPVPGDDLDALEYALRYGQNPNLKAASVVAAYMALIEQNERTRRRVLPLLRRELPKKYRKEA